MKHAARGIFFPHLRVFEIVWVLRLLLSVQVVERTIEFAEAVRGRQMFVAIAEVVLSELTGVIALRLEQFRDRHISCLQTLFSAGQAHLEKAGAETRLAGDEARPPGGTALLTIPIREERAFPGDAVNVRCLVAHHSLVVGADVPVADVVAPDDEDVGLLWICSAGNTGGY